MPWLRTYVTTCAGFVLLVFAVLVLIVSFVDLGLSGHGIAAMFIGTLLTVGVGMVLMGLVFSSSRSGRDENVRGAGIHKAPGTEPERPKR